MDRRLLIFSSYQVITSLKCCIIYSMTCLKRRYIGIYIRSLGWGKIEGTRWCSGRKRWSTRETILIFICLRVQAFGGVETLGGAVQERLWSQSQSQCSQFFIECNVALNSSQCIKNERTDWGAWISLFQENNEMMAKTFMQICNEIFYL